MCFEPLSPEFTKTRVAILDDQPHQVEKIADYLRRRNYAVEIFSDRAGFLGAIGKRVFAVQLIDISLSVSDTAGLEVASTAAKIDPQALRICISKDLDDISASSIVPALNARMHEGDMPPLSLSDALGVRDLWAMHDKHDKDEDLFRLIENYRLMIGCGDSTVIEADPELIDDFGSSFSSIRWDDATLQQEPQVQFVEIVRQLARRPGQQSISRIRLQKIGKGRSKTVVAHMSIEFDTENGGAAGKGFTVERQQIIKIGRIASIAREVRNYAHHVPRLFSSVFCPTIEAVGRSRTLAGVAYSRVSDSKRHDVAPTLLESLYGHSETVSCDEAEKAFNHAFAFRDGCDVAPDHNGRSLFRAYKDRFGALEDKPNRPTLDVLLEDANQRLLKANVIQDFNGARFFGTPGAGGVKAASSVAELVHPHSPYEEFYSALCHGDLHLDNILLVRQGKSLINVYIDFADVDRHHVVIDYVVMEVAVRFQSLRFLLDTVGADALQQNEDELLRRLAEFEFALLAGKKRWPPGKTHPDGLAEPAWEWLKRTARLILQVRRQSCDFVEQDLREALGRYCAENPAARREVEGELEKERQRYYCGLGLASLAAMDLRQPDELQALHRSWFAVVGQLLMHRFNEWKQKVIPQ